MPMKIVLPTFVHCDRLWYKSLMCFRLIKITPSNLLLCQSHICRVSSMPLLLVPSLVTGSPCFPGAFCVALTQCKKSTCQCRRHRRCGFDPWIGKILWRRSWQSTPALLPGESPWIEEPGRPQSMGLQRVRHDWVTEHSISSAQCCRIISLFRSTYFSISLVRKKSLLSFCWLWKQSPHSEVWHSRLSHSFFTYPGYRPHRIFGSVFEPAIHFLWRRKWQPTPVFLPGESCGWRSLVGCCP